MKLVRNQRATPSVVFILILALVLGQLAAPLRASAGLFGDFSLEDEKKLGKKYYTLIKATYPIVEDPEIVGYVKDVVERVAQTLPPQPFPVITTVVRSNSINAFATPGGYVYVFTGLLTEFDQESQLAGVIAHELAHVTQRHVAKRIAQQQITSLGMLAGVLAGMLIGQGGGDSSQAASQALIIGSMAGAQSSMLNYSRIDEREADQVGMNYLVEAGYPPTGMMEGFKKIRHKQYLSGSSIPAYLSTHPAVDERIGYLEERIADLPAEVRQRAESENRFPRIKTLCLARYTDIDGALSTFRTGTGSAALDFMGMGILFSRRNQVKEAAEAFDSALRLAPNDPLVLREAGRFHYLQGDASKATSYLTKAMLLNPKDLMALFFMARLQADRGETDRAVDYYRRLLKTLPEDPELHFYLARTLGSSGNNFEGHLHLAYWGIYSLNKKKAEFHKEKTGALAETEEQKASYKTLCEVFDERDEFWKELDKGKK
ncbi:MAG: M48 family metalloprotease [Proteobacteria bacterium]|nr:M48 family metalloprotease [Pseudomonadota bacterium]